LHAPSRLSSGISQTRAPWITDPNGWRLRRIVDVHLHTVLMLAAVALIWLFVGIVVTVTWLVRRGRLGTPDRLVPFRSYGPVLAGACSGGAAAVHLTVIGEHALQAAPGAGLNASAFLCSIGAGSAHFSTVDASIAGFLPLGIVSVGTIGAQVALAVPRVWERRRLALVGAGVALVAIVAALIPGVVGVPQPDGSVAITTVGYSDALALIFEVTLLGVVGLLIWARPQRVIERLQVTVTDAYVATGLGVGSVVVFTIAAVFAGHAVH
jgi:uncharacterized membrane protein YidH (DUF202 family)